MVNNNSEWVEVEARNLDLERVLKNTRKSLFFNDLTSAKNGGRNYNLGLWNLTICIGQLKLYSQGIKPSRNWKITDLKKYFNIKGSAEKMLFDLMILDEHIKSVQKGEK